MCRLTALSIALEIALLAQTPALKRVALRQVVQTHVPLITALTSRDLWGWNTIRFIIVSSGTKNYSTWHLFRTFTRESDTTTRNKMCIKTPKQCITVDLKFSTKQTIENSKKKSEGRTNADAIVVKI